ncbi:YbfB/YjiJ family MFS transporter, partial [Streptomyces sp. NPDC005483]|uniref:YbfB/YjiJ family MFS transporter n=1 Tax=Streptomyces sp. NPDC005483 TaxID=3154882 RepID=UPI0033A70F9F
MGVGRFAYTPILPLMHTRASPSAGAGANLATANYVGHLVDALAGILAPALAAAMGVGRFAYTPILPLMHTRASPSAGAGANLATANYV